MLLRVSVGLVAPFKAEPPNRHWYENGPSPVSPNESSVFAPALNVRLKGGCVITGGFVGAPGAKLAVMSLLDVSASTSGFRLPAASPLQPVKVWFAAGQAVNVTGSPFV